MPVIKCEAEIVIWNNYISTFPFLFCEEFHYCHAFALHCPLYVSFLWASHLFEERLGSKGPKGSPVFSADALRTYRNPVLGGMKDKCFIWDPACCFPSLFPPFWAIIRQLFLTHWCFVLQWQLTRKIQVMVINEQTKMLATQQFVVHRRWSCHIVNQLQNIFTKSVNSLYTTPKPCSQKQDLDLNETIINHCESLKLPCNLFGRGAAMKVIQHPQDLSPANRPHLAEPIPSSDSKDSNFCLALDTKKYILLCLGLEIKRNKNSITGCHLGVLLNSHKSSRWLVTAEHHSVAAEC